jgi:hypothetical protein
MPLAGRRLLQLLHPARTSTASSLLHRAIMSSTKRGASKSPPKGGEVKKGKAGAWGVWLNVGVCTTRVGVEFIPVCGLIDPIGHKRLKQNRAPGDGAVDQGHQHGAHLGGGHGAEGQLGPPGVSK